MKNILLATILICNMGFAQAQDYDTITVHFALNDPKLNKQGKDLIDSLVFHDVLFHWQKLTVLGYTDYLGGKAYNEVLSEERAKNVVAYLLEMGFDEKDIKLIMGKGKIDHVPVPGKEGIASDRKVQIIIDPNQKQPMPVTTTAMPVPAKQVQAPPPSGAVAPVKKITKIDLTSIKTNEAINLKNLMFEGDRHILLKESEPEMENLYRLMKENPNVRIQIEGHICCLDPKDGTDKKDEDNSGWLSETRAKAVFDYLVTKGIDPKRMKHKGFGNTHPLIYPETTEEQHIKNRRVEIRILGK